MTAQGSSLGRASAANVARVTAVAYAGAAFMFLGALLPHTDAIVWAWLVPGLAVVATVVVLSSVRLLLLTRGQEVTTSRNQLLGENLACLVGLAATSYGLSGSFGMYRLTLLVPVLLMAVVGTDRMLAVSWTMSVSLLVLVTAGSLYDFTPLPAFVVVYGVFRRMPLRNLAVVLVAMALPGRRVNRPNIVRG